MTKRYVHTEDIIVALAAIGAGFEHERLGRVDVKCKNGVRISVVRPATRLAPKPRPARKEKR